MFTILVIVAVVLLVPSRPGHRVGTIDWAGAAGLAIGLSGVLLAITQAHVWGWLSVRIIGCGVIGVTSLGLWWWWERRCAQPLVSTSMLARRPILLTNIATVLVGMGLYFAFLGLTGFVEAPVRSGYGFGATVLAASVVFLLPGAFAGFLTSLASGRYIDRFGARAVLIAGPRRGRRFRPAGDRAFRALAGDRGRVLANAYISLAYGALLPALVVRRWRPARPGSRRA